MTAGLLDWDCFGPGPSHKPDLEFVASAYHSASTDIEVQRCRTCGLCYHVCRSEIADWSGGRDYYDETTIWTPLAPDELDAARQDSNYRPRSGQSHRHDTGWR